MKITAICASPKGEQSVTVQYLRFLQKKFPDAGIEMIHIGHRVKSLEKKKTDFDAVIDRVRECDSVMWCFPVYDCVVPCQLKRFIELLHERDCTGVFGGKYCAALTTSVHYFDHTAHNYIQAVSEDMGMRVVPGISLEMNDLLKESKRDELTAFFRFFLEAMREEWSSPRAFSPLPGITHSLQLPVPSDRPKSSDFSVLLVSDAEPSDKNLLSMIDFFVKSMPDSVDCVNLRELTVKSGCLSCYRCVMENVCSVRDDLSEKLEPMISRADALVFAGTIRDRFLSSVWKTFIDRGFYNGHVPRLDGKALAWLVSGPLRSDRNIRQILTGQCLNYGARLVGIVTDEDRDDQVAEQLTSLGEQLSSSLRRPAPAFESFLTVGSRLLFRDMVYRTRFLFQADNRYYKRHGIYDFPQKNYGERLFNFVMMTLMLIPGFRRGFMAQAKTKMLEPYEKVLAGTDPEAQRS